MQTTTNFSTELKSEYIQLFQSCQTQPLKRVASLATAGAILLRKSRYLEVSRQTSVPWFFIGVIHQMEASGNFKTHLHNGDFLTSRTVHVPKGRPVSGKPPFTWEESAVDALRYMGLNSWHDWGVPGCLYQLEKYNGMGYRKRGLRSPYLWGGSLHEQLGKFTSDGSFNKDARTKQIGAATLLHVMLWMKVIEIS